MTGVWRGAVFRSHKQDWRPRVDAIAHARPQYVKGTGKGSCPVDCWISWSRFPDLRDYARHPRSHTSVAAFCYTVATGLGEIAACTRVEYLICAR